MSANNTEILSYCGSCKMDLMAAIVAKDGAKVVKVQCKTCKKEHGYKAAKGVKEPSAKAVEKARVKKEAAAKVLEEQTKHVEAEWRTLMEGAHKAPRVKYNIKKKLAIGEVVEHPKFGDGVVMKLCFPNKAEVIFRTDVKVLIHSV